MGFRLLRAEDQNWRPTNALGVVNANISGQLGARDLSVRVWRLAPGQAIPRHRHQVQTELYLLLSGTGRLRVDETLLNLEPMSAVLVEPESLRQVFNDSDAESVWLIAGTPPESFPLGTEAYAHALDYLYPDGVEALPPELDTGTPRAAGSDPGGA